MATVGAIVSLDTLKDFYERHPYPPPVEDLGKYAETWRDEQRRRAEFHLFWPFKSYREDLTVLVAGCGTSQAAKYAIRWPGAKVVGIDLSDNSLENTQKLKDKHGLRNLELHQLPLDRASELGKSFDLVVSTGVLHHLQDPPAGLRALGQCLAPDGAFHLMVYAPYGRAGIYMLQEYCRRLGIGTSAQDISELMQSLRSLPPNHPIVPLLQNSPDFSDQAAVADALLHPQDRAYSVDELMSLIESCDLQFGRWIFQAPYLPDCGGLTQSPHLDRLRALDRPAQFAAVELFRGNMLRHSAILYDTTVDRHPGTLDFSGVEWSGYVPIKRANTIQVEESLPPTAAAVLINQNHTQTDIYLPIDANQKKLWEAVDGRSAIGDLADRSGCDPETARLLLSRLWWYDQIVLDCFGTLAKD